MTSTLAGMLAVFDVTETAPHTYSGDSDAGDRDLIDASQLLGQAAVAATKSIPSKKVRRVSGVFCRPVRAHESIDFAVDVVQNGRTFATVIVTASQEGKTCGTVSLLMDVPEGDVMRHPVVPPSSNPHDAIPLDMPVEGRELRLVGLADPNDPDEVGPPRIECWVRYDETPGRDDLRRALLAHFTGHLSISTTMRAHPGIGTAMSHRTISTAVMAIEITFHEPADWDGWIVYEHDSTFVGAGMSFVRGQVRDESGRLIASFSQDGMIRELRADSVAASITESARL